MIDLPILERAALAPKMAAGVEAFARGRVYVETYGCQMNEADTEVVLGVLAASGYLPTTIIEEADVVLLNTCSIREQAEDRIYGRLTNILGYKRARPGMVVGLLGCMAERMRKSLVDEKGIVDLVVGPDEYRRIGELVEDAMHGTKGVAVKLSRVETYDDVPPLRTEGISAWISVMRGCDKFCTFCVVPFTRGRERSRTVAGVVREVRQLAARGFREVTLLGQNVNSFDDAGTNFSNLLVAVATAAPEMRFRFTTSHPEDMSDALIDTLAAHDNLCKYIHLPVQSGSDRILKLMNRTYSAEHYLGRVRRIREAMPHAALSTDVIAGFCTETDDDHRRTLDLLAEVRYDGAFTFKYSPRGGTKAWEFGDDVSEEVKSRRLTEIIDLQRRVSLEINGSHVGKLFPVLIEGPSRKSDTEWCGRTDTNKTVVFPRADARTGEYRLARIERASAATLFGVLA